MSSSPRSGGPASEAARPAAPPPAVVTPEYPALSRRQAALILSGIMAGILMGALDNFVVVTALPHIVIDLHQTNGVPFVVSAYLIAATVATPLFGKLSDIYSRRAFFVLGLGIFIVGSLLAGVSQSVPQLIAFRAIQGFGSGAFFPIGIAIIGVLFTPQTRARLTGAFSSVFGIATILGPFLGSYIVDNTTWRWVFYVNLPIGFAAIAIVQAAVGPLRPTARSRFDTLGAGLLAGWVGALMLALVENSDSGWAWTDPRILGLLVTAVVLFVAFVVWELRAAEPVVPLRFFAKRVIAASSSIALLRGAVMFGVTTFVSIYVALVLGGGADTIRDVLWFFVVPMIIGSVIGGQLLPKLPYRVLAVAGMGTMTIGAILLGQVRGSTPTWLISYGFLPTGGLGLDLMPLGLGLGVTFAVTLVAVQYAVPPKDIGAASSLVQFLQSLGGAIGLALLSSYQQSRFTALDPVPSGAVCPIPLTGPPSTVCLPFYSAYRAAASTAYSETFLLVLVLAVGALVAAFFITGRLPKGRVAGPPGGGTVPSGELGARPATQH